MFKNKLTLRNVVVIAICLTATAFFSACTAEKTTERQVRLSLEGKSYDNLYLIISTTRGITQCGTPSIIHGTTTDGYNWTFLVPDSIAKISKYFAIRSENKEDVHHIIFQTIINGNTLRSRTFNFDKNENIIKLTGTFDNSRRLGNTILLNDYFTTPLPENTFLRESMQMPWFSSFFDRNNPNKTYEEFLTKYADLIKESPNSHYFMTSLFMTSHHYRSKEDVEKLFNLFSPEMQKTIWGEAVRRIFAPPVFEGINDTILLNSLTKEYERIILDPAKYTLICFSASWCAPCIIAIPMLKKIHEKTKGKMNLVYISIDGNIDDWNALMERENIAWRSLWLDLRNTSWRISAVPTYILVAPNGDTREIFLRTEADIQELYAVLGIE